LCHIHNNSNLISIPLHIRTDSDRGYRSVVDVFSKEGEEEDDEEEEREDEVRDDVKEEEEKLQ
jgi:hypothetical protein